MTDIIIEIDPNDLRFSTSEKDWQRYWGCLPNLWIFWEHFKNNQHHEEQRDFRYFVFEQDERLFNIEMNAPDNDRWFKLAKGEIENYAEELVPSGGEKFALTKTIFNESNGIVLGIIVVISENGVDKARLALQCTSDNENASKKDLIHGFVDWFFTTWLLEKEREDVDEFIEMLHKKPVFYKTTDDYTDDFKSKLHDFGKNVQSDLIVTAPQLIKNEILSNIKVFVRLDRHEIFIVGKAVKNAFLKIDDKKVGALVFEPDKPAPINWRLLKDKSDVRQSSITTEIKQGSIDSKKFQVRFCSTTENIELPFDRISLNEGFELLGLGRDFLFSSDGVFEAQKNQNYDDGLWTSIDSFSHLNFNDAVWGALFYNTGTYKELEDVVYPSDMTKNYVHLLRMNYENQSLKDNIEKAITIYNWFSEKVFAFDSKEIYKDFKEAFDCFQWS